MKLVLAKLFSSLHQPMLLQMVTLEVVSLLMEMNYKTGTFFAADAIKNVQKADDAAVLLNDISTLHLEVLPL